MTAHVVYEALDDRPRGRSRPPSSTSSATRYGFGGLLMTDDISMGALSGSVAGRSAAANRVGLRSCLALQRRSGRNGGGGRCRRAAETKRAETRAEAALAARDGAAHGDISTPRLPRRCSSGS